TDCVKRTNFFRKSSCNRKNRRHNQNHHRLGKRHTVCKAPRGGEPLHPSTPQFLRSHFLGRSASLYLLGVKCVLRGECQSYREMPFIATQYSLNVQSKVPDSPSGTIDALESITWENSSMK